MKNQILSKRSKWITGIMLSLGVFLLSFVFAEGEATHVCSRRAAEFMDTLYRMTQFASWLRIILAKFVGKLMTNGLVYAEALQMDTYLRKIRQMVRNLVNFAIGFFFLYHVLKYVLSPSSNEKPPQEIIKKSLFTGVLVQMSWFIVMVLVDLSTILVATVSSFPAQLVSNNQQLQLTIELVKNRDEVLQHMKDSAVVYTIDGGLSTKIVDLPQRREIPRSEFFDQILPQPDDLSGPLMWLGFSIFKTNNYLKYNTNTAAGVSCQDGVFKEFFQFILYSAGLLLFTLSLLVLAIVLIIRLAYIWVAIALSPVIIFIKQFEIKKLAQASIGGFLNQETIISMIFQPVKFCFFIGLMMMIVVMYQSFFTVNYKGSSFADGNVQITMTQNGEKDYSSKMEVNGLLNVNMNNAKMTFQEFFIAVIALAFMWMIVKVAITDKTGVKRLDGFTEGVGRWAQTTLESTPIISAPHGSLAIGDIYSKEQQTSALLDNQTSKFSQQFAKKTDEQDQALRKFLGIAPNELGLSEEQKGSLNRIVNKGGGQEVIEEYQSTVSKSKKERRIGFNDINYGLYMILSKTPNGYRSIPDRLSKISAFISSNIYGKKPDEIESALKGATLEQFQTFYRYALDIPDAEKNIPTSLEQYQKNPDKRRLEIAK